MRIALVVDYALDYLGGAQSAFLDAARVLVEHGDEVTIVAPERGLGAATAGIGAAVLGIPSRGTLPGVDLPVIRSTPRLRARLRAAFGARGVEAVHVHSEFGLAAAAVAAARELGLPTVQTVHTFFWRAPMPRGVDRAAAAAIRGFARWLRGPGPAAPEEPARLAAAAPGHRAEAALKAVTASLASRVDVVVSPSAHQAERLREAGLPRVVAIPNPDAARRAEPEGPGAEAPLADATPPLRLVWVGRLVPEKRPEVLLDAVRRVAAAAGEGALRVELVGAGPLEATLRRDAPASAVLLGRRSREEVAERMRAAHALVLTSSGFDNQPVVIVEALHARRGVILCDPALTEGLTGGAGLWAAAPDADALAGLLLELVRDPGRLVAASRAAEAGAVEFDPGRHVARLHELYAPGTSSPR